MLKLHEAKLLPYSPKELFALVIDVESYPAFLPFCVSSKKISESAEDGLVTAEVGIKFGFMSQSYTSLIKPKFAEDKASIDITAITGPFKHLHSFWNFTQAKEGTNVEFSLDFEFESAFLNKMMSGYLKEAYGKMMNAFEKRAEEIYGNNKNTT